MPPLDPASTAALVASLASMADDGEFVLESAPTFFRLLGPALSPGMYPAALVVQPAPGEQAYLVGFAMMYRRQVFRGLLVCGLANVPTAKGLLAQNAQYQVQVYDQRHPVTPYTAGGSGVKAGP